MSVNRPLLVIGNARVIRALLKAASFFALLALVSFGTGCGALSAMANPKVGWALNDPAPMSVVVRRVDTAAATAAEVDRLLVSTPGNESSAWLAATAPSGADAAGEMKALVEEPMYKQSRARVVAAEVWARVLHDVKGDASGGANLLVAINAELGDKYERVMEKKRAVAKLRGDIAVEEAARDAKGVSDADKKTHQTKIDELEKQAKALEDELDPLRKDFLAAAKALAAKASPEVREKIGPVLVNLRQAVDDADVANGAAAVRYPFAVSGIIGSLKEMVPIFVADIIEEQTGARPKLDGFQPDVSLEGGEPKITINGLSKDDLGKVKLGDLTTETVKRSKSWVGHVTTLLGAVASNKETLSFEADALDAIIEGFTSAGWKKSTAVTIPAHDSKDVVAATAHAHRSRKSQDSAVASATPGKAPAKAPAKTQDAAVAAKPKTDNVDAKPAPSALKDERGFAAKARPIKTLQDVLVRLIAKRDHASDDERPAVLVEVAEAYMELDYAATASKDATMADTARREAIAAYEEIHRTSASSVDEAMLFHLAIAYDRDGNDAMTKKTLAELKRRFPSTKLASRS